MHFHGDTRQNMWVFLYFSSICSVILWIYTTFGKIEPMEITYAASDLGVNCLSTSQNKDAMLIWV